MSPAPAARPFEVRHLQLARAALAAVAALMITFSPDHSADLGLSVFSGFAIATAMVLFLSAWLAFGPGRRGPVVLLGALSIVAGMAAGVQPIRSEGLFFGVVIVWALATGIAEGVQGLRARRTAAAGTQARSDARDALIVGILGVLLALGLAVVPAGYALNYTVAEAHQTFTLTGITIGVGVFGGYAAIVAVYLGIAGFSPRRADADAHADADDGAGAGADTDPERAAASAADEHSGGAA